MTSAGAPIVLSQVAQLVAGTLSGDPQLAIRGAATLADVELGEITLVDAADRLPQLDGTLATAAIVPRGANYPRLPTIEVDDVHAAFARVVMHFHPPRAVTRTGISPQARISPTARIAANVDVHAGAVIGDEAEIGAGSTIYGGVHVMAGCQIGERVTLFPNVVLYENTVVGPRSIIHAGAVLGAYGFGYRTQNGRHELSAQLGWVEVGADVEIGANSTIDRGTYGPTRVGEGTKIDDQVMIAHNCHIGRHNMLCSQVGIAGSSTTGDYVVMAGQAGIRDHVHIGTGAVLGAMSGVMAPVPEKAIMLGIPATPEREQMVKQAALARLPEMRREFKRLQHQVDELTRRLEGGDRQAA